MGHSSGEAADFFLMRSSLTFKGSEFKTTLTVVFDSVQPFLMLNVVVVVVKSSGLMLDMVLSWLK